MSEIFKVLLLFMCLLKCINSEGYYTIVGSKTLRPNAPYKISVNSHRLNVQSIFKIGIEGKHSLNNQIYTNVKTITVDQHQTQMVTIDIGNVNLTDCKLIAESNNGIIFKNSTALSFNGKTVSIFVITDKAVYKPDDLVHFRVLLLDYKLLPRVHNNELNIQIMDPQGNQIKNWTNKASPKGVFSSEFQLGSSPILGKWTLNVTIMNMVFIKNFDVDKYVLPLFDVIINTPRHISLSSGKIVAKVYSKYSFGKLVKGNATLKAWATNGIGEIQQLESSVPFQKTVDTTGVVRIEFNIAKELNLVIENGREVDVILEATVIEQLTGISYKKTSTVSLHFSEYKINFESDTSGYINGFPYTSWVKVSYHDGTPVIDNINPVIIKYKFEEGAEGSVEDRLMLNNEGITKLNVNAQTANVLETIEANYLTATEEHYFERKSSDNNVFIQAKIRTEQPKAGDEIKIIIKSNQPMTYYTYQIIGKGTILSTNTVMVSNRKYDLLTINSTFAMVPQTTFIVYYIHSDGQMVYDAIDIKLPSDFQNNVKLGLSTINGHPNHNISITVRAKPKSFVGILAVDKSVLLLKKGNNLEVTDIFKDLNEYDLVTINNKHGFSEFENAGAVIITNVKPNTVGENEDEDETLITKSSLKSSKVHIRKDFPETWIWETINDNGLGETILNKKIPDTITTWVLTGFAIDLEYGFGMTKIPTELNVFKNFFISTNLPYSIKQGETVSIPIVVFNYQNKAITANITLENTLLEFDFKDVKQDEEERSLDTNTKNVKIGPNSGTSVNFLIKPKKNGHITIKITAESKTNVDSIEKKLLVVPQGILKYADQSVFFDLRSRSRRSTILSSIVPSSSVVPNTTTVRFTVFGDFLGPTLKNLNNLIVLPTGCGEQTMMKIVANIIAINYLEKTSQLTPSVRTTAVNNIITGYQNQLKFKLNDGSFVVWENYKTGSTLLTAYITRFFIQAKTYIYIDSNIINRGLDWLRNRQTSYGAFQELGFNYQSIQGDVALTAFVTLSYLESVIYRNQYSATVNRGLNYLATRINSSPDTLSLAILTYCLQVGGHSSKGTALLKLQSRAVSVGDTLHWVSSSPGANSINIQTTGYALLAYLEAELYIESLPIVNWLVASMNAKGGFFSSQDTIVALLALSKFPGYGLTPSYNVRVSAQHGNGDVLASYNVNKNNAMNLQTIELPSEYDQFTIKGDGNGIAIAKLSYTYYESGDGSWPRFEVNAVVSSNVTQDYFHLTICTKYIPEGEDMFSGMSVMEVNLPSGFTIYPDSLKHLIHYNVTKSEIENENTRVILYFKNIFKSKICPHLSASRTVEVNDLKPSAITVYDYYDNTKNARSFYKINETLLCNTCKGSECPVCPAS